MAPGVVKPASQASWMIESDVLLLPLGPSQFMNWLDKSILRERYQDH